MNGPECPCPAMFRDVAYCPDCPRRTCVCDCHPAQANAETPKHAKASEHEYDPMPPQEQGEHPPCRVCGRPFSEHAKASSAPCFCGHPDDRERVHRAHACEPWTQRGASSHE